MTGKYIPLIVLVLITIGIYYYIIANWSDIIFMNDYYIIILLILMLLDITSLIIIFIYGDFLGVETVKNSDKRIKISNKKNK